MGSRRQGHSSGVSDAEISTGQVAWIDDHNGTVRLIVKVKTPAPVTLHDGDQVHVVMEIAQAKLSLADISTFARDHYFSPERN
jgi:hypothetical protein